MESLAAKTSKMVGSEVARWLWSLLAKQLVFFKLCSKLSSNHAIAVSSCHQSPALKTSLMLIPPSL